MLDLFFVATGLACFGLAVAYTYGCEKLRGRHD
jgi:hypothetical protein